MALVTAEPALVLIMTLSFSGQASTIKQMTSEETFAHLHGIIERHQLSAVQLPSSDIGFNALVWKSLQHWQIGKLICSWPHAIT